MVERGGRGVDNRGVDQRQDKRDKAASLGKKVVVMHHNQDLKEEVEEAPKSKEEVAEFWVS